MRRKKKKLPPGCLPALFVMTVAVVLISLCTMEMNERENSRNLARHRGVTASCDSVESEELSAKRAIDGDDETLSSRWSSENNWEDASHYIELEFPEEISVSFVVLKWERTNVTAYQLEGSLNGEDWEVLAAFDQAPASKRQEIPLAEASVVRFLRLTTSAVSQSEEDYSNLYQNVSLYEFEVYADKPLSYLLEEPVIETGKDGNRYLCVPKVPEAYQITYQGADYEQVIGADCEVYETIQDKEVTVGFLLEHKEGKEEPEEVAFTIQVPAAKDDLQGGNQKPDVIPAIAEWDGADGTWRPGEEARIVVSDQGLLQTAELFAERYQEIMHVPAAVVEGTVHDVRAGDFYLEKEAGDAAGIVRGLGTEGYVCDITDRCVIRGVDEQGIYWGTVTALQILKTQDGTMPQGRMRDYPKYSVRGFGIDVARKPVSMAMLYQIMKNMSWYKMNDLCIHLNDNVILSTSGLTASVEEAMTADSAFRLESSVENEKGEKLTSSDYAYSAKEFAGLVNAAKAYGVQVVPEIDTPAHSLAITRLFPEYALTVRNEAVDQIDLSNKKAVELVKTIWKESLDTAFADAAVVNIGMDEYYGDGETYRKYLNEILSFVRENSTGETGNGIETIRLWGSLSNIEGTTVPAAEKLQMNLWSTVWADPLSMYESGYSLINMQNNHLYIIPGGGYDYLDAEELFHNWEANRFYDHKHSEIIPAYSPQMLGAAYMIWNDMCGSLDVGISEQDLFDRFFAPLTVVSGKLWGEVSASYEDWTAQGDLSGISPDSDPYASLRLEEGKFVWPADAPEEPVSLKGGSDFIETGYQGGYGNGYGTGGDYTVKMQVYRSGDSTAPEEILFETDTAYGQTAFKAVQKGTGQVGFSREGRDYSFAYTLPEGEWVELMVRQTGSRIALYVNGKLTDTLGSEEPFEEYAAFFFPLERIGSKTDSFHGMIKGIEMIQEAF